VLCSGPACRAHTASAAGVVCHCARVPLVLGAVARTDCAAARRWRGGGVAEPLMRDHVWCPPPPPLPPVLLRLCDSSLGHVHRLAIGHVHTSFLSAHRHIGGRWRTTRLHTSHALIWHMHRARTDAHLCFTARLRPAGARSVFGRPSWTAVWICGMSRRWRPLRRQSRSFVDS